MKTRALLTLFLLILGAAAVCGQEAGKTVKIRLKSGESVGGILQKIDEEGVTLKGDDGIALFLRWSLVRGDLHYDLREEATDLESVASLLKLADFCHEFALDKKEVEVLRKAEGIEPSNPDVLRRLEELGEAAGAPADDPPETDPGDEPEGPDPDPEPEDPQPKDPPAGGEELPSVSVSCDDEDVRTALVEALAEAGFSVVLKDGEIRVEVEVELELKNNPTFYGKELFAIYDGKLVYKLFRPGEKKPFREKTANEEDCRDDTRVLAAKKCRANLVAEAAPGLIKALQDG